MITDLADSNGSAALIPKHFMKSDDFCLMTRRRCTPLTVCLDRDLGGSWAGDGLVASVQFADS